MSTKLYVGNLPYETTESDLQALFESAGQVSTINVVKDRATGQARGFAFVEMSDAEGARKAISELDKHQYGGRSLTLTGQAMMPRGNGGGGGYGGGFSATNRAGKRGCQLGFFTRTEEAGLKPASTFLDHARAAISGSVIAARQAEQTASKPPPVTRPPQRRDRSIALTPYRNDDSSRVSAAGGRQRRCRHAERRGNVGDHRGPGSPSATDRPVARAAKWAITQIPTAPRMSASAVSSSTT
jgi:hypothetical protein